MEYVCPDRDEVESAAILERRSFKARVKLNGVLASADAGYVLRDIGAVGAFVGHREGS